jgi:hypothetical protein
MAIQQTLPAPNVRFVSRVLIGNAAFGILCGLICLLWTQPLAVALGIEPPVIVTILGVGLLLFAAELIWIALRAPADRRLLSIIFGLDVAWVIGSAILLLSGWLPLTTAGTWTVLVVADVVAIFAVLEFIGLRRLSA